MTDLRERELGGEKQQQVDMSVKWPQKLRPQQLRLQIFICLELQDDHKKREPQLGGSMASKTDLFHVFNSYVPSVLEI